MSGRITAPRELQPVSFAFSAENLKKAKAIIAKYPAGRQASAVMPLLDIAQRQQEGNWVSIAAMNVIADLLAMPYIKVYEVATFYTMYNLAPVGKYLLQICRTTPCWLRGSDEVTDAICSHLHIGMDETTEDGLFTAMEVECLGACVNAPVVQINDDFYEDLDAKNVVTVLESLKNGKALPMGSQIGRQTSAPIGVAANDVAAPAAKKTTVRKPKATKGE